ncbi:MAG: hypothetical protein ACXVB0_02350 [Mucilaginibacter sp.]
MKKVFILSSLVVITFLMACNKKVEVKTQPNLQSIIGKWHMVFATMLDGREAATTWAWSYTFNADSTFVYETTATVTKTIGKFHVGQQQSIADGKMHPYITLTYKSNSGQDITTSDIISFENDFLILSGNDNYATSNSFYGLRDQ